MLILMAEGAPGNPGMQVLNAAISEKGPLPHELMAHTLNLYALPGCSSTLTIFCSPACNRGRLHYVSLYPPSLSLSYLVSFYRDLVTSHGVLCSPDDVNIMPLHHHLLLPRGGKDGPIRVTHFGLDRGSAFYLWLLGKSRKVVLLYLQQIAVSCAGVKAEMF